MSHRQHRRHAAKALTSRYGGLNKAGTRRGASSSTGCAATLIYVNWGVAIIETLKHFGVSVYVPERQVLRIPSATMGEMDIYRTQWPRTSILRHHADADYDRHPAVPTAIRPGASGQRETGRLRAKKMMDIVLFPGRGAEGEAAAEGEAGREAALCTSRAIMIMTKDRVPAPVYSSTTSKRVPDLENQSCCGFGGTFSIKNYPHTKQIGKLKPMRSRPRARAPFHRLPGCAMNLTDATWSEGVHVRQPSGRRDLRASDQTAGQEWLLVVSWWLFVGRGFHRTRPVNHNCADVSAS